MYGYICIDEYHYVAARQRCAEVACERRASRAITCPDDAIRHRAGNLSCPIGASVVDDDQLPLVPFEIASRKRGKRNQQMVLRVESGDDDRRPGLFSHSL